MNVLQKYLTSARHKLKSNVIQFLLYVSVGQQETEIKYKENIYVWCQMILTVLDLKTLYWTMVGKSLIENDFVSLMCSKDTPYIKYIVNIGKHKFIWKLLK